jgi:hypothetical protein
VLDYRGSSPFVIPNLAAARVSDAWTRLSLGESGVVCLSLRWNKWIGININLQKTYLQASSFCEDVRCWSSTHSHYIVLTAIEIIICIPFKPFRRTVSFLRYCENISAGAAAARLFGKARACL